MNTAALRFKNSQLSSRWHGASGKGLVSVCGNVNFASATQPNIERFINIDQIYSVIGSRSQIADSLIRLIAQLSGSVPVQIPIASTSI